MVNNLKQDIGFLQSSFFIQNEKVSSKPSRKYQLFSAVYAQEINLSIADNESFGSLGEVTAETIISGSIVALLIIASIGFFFMLAIGGIKWITSGGDKEKVDGAKRQITGSLLGVGIIFSAWALVSLIEVFFNVDITSMELPTFVEG